MIQAGQELSIRWREAKKDHPIVYRNLVQMRLTPENNGNPEAACYCTHVSQEGISVYIVRGYVYGGDMEAFLLKSDVLWQVYFEPLNAFNMSYARSAHFSKAFPRAFLGE